MLIGSISVARIAGPPIARADVLRQPALAALAVVHLAPHGQGRLPPGAARLKRRADT